MAERGTNPKNWDDIKTDVQQGWGSDTAQYDQGIKLAQVVKKTFGDKFNQLTGDSLGGGRAASESAVTGVPAITFNAAGVNANTIHPYGVSPQQAASKIQKSNVDGQILNDLDGLKVGSHTSPPPLRTNIPLPAVDANGNPLPWSPQVAPVKDAWNPMRQAKHAEDYYKREKAIVVDGVDRHGIDKVQNALEKEERQDAATITQALKTPAPLVPTHHTCI